MVDNMSLVDIDIVIPYIGVVLPIRYDPGLPSRSRGQVPTVIEVPSPHWAHAVSRVYSTLKYPYLGYRYSSRVFMG